MLASDATEPAVGPRDHGGRLAIDIAPSPAFAVLLVLLHGASLAWLVPAALPPWLELALASAVVAHLAGSLRRHALRTSPDALVGVHRTPEGRWYLTTRRGVRLPATLEPGGYVHPALIVLIFVSAGRRHELILIPGMARADALRRLRVCLRLESGQGGEGPP